MASEIWLHLLCWELRYALRRSLFWVMLGIAALVPPLFAWALAIAYGQGPALLYSPGCGAQSVLVALLVATWTVYSVKRQVSTELSDDWLLIISWRQSLLTRYVAAAALGLLIATASIVTMLLAARLDAGADRLAVWHAQLPVLASVWQGLASAAVVVGAADFLLASQATVISVQLAFSLFWSFVPVLGFFWPAWMANETGTFRQPTLAAAYQVLALLACGLALFYGWRRSEDFWLLLRAGDRRGKPASIGEIRGELSSSQSGTGASLRAARFGWRETFADWGLDPLVSHDLARFPALVLPRDAAGWQRLRTFAVSLSGIVLLYMCAIAWFTGRAAETGVWRIFLWWAGALVVMLRALSSGVQVAAQEREQSTLPALAIAPVGLVRMLTGKVLVVLVQAAPWLLLLRWAAAGHRELPIAFVVIITAIAAMVGPCAAGWLPGRLVATLVGGATTLVGSLAVYTLLYRPVAWRWDTLNFEHPILPAGDWLPTLVVGLAMVGVWQGLGWVAEQGLRRAAGAQTA